ncbi:MAG: N-acetylglucosamine-6-phosphate deacetylase [Pirellulales bacterium]
MPSAAHRSNPPSPPLLITGGTLVLPDGVIEGGSVVCQQGRITEVLRRPPRASLLGAATVIDARGGLIAPGFVDLHVHGGGGADFMDATDEAVRTAIAAHAAEGTTTLFPTTTTASPAEIQAMLAACRRCRDAWQPGDGARIAGVHVYGPYFAPDKTGCHAADVARSPDPTEYASWFCDDLVRIATSAAELPGAEAFYRRAAKAGCLVTCGHSNADWAEMQRAFDCGMRHVDHFWCAMSSVVSLRSRFGTPMRASMEQFVLATPEMSTEVLADGHHLSPELLDFAYRQKGPERLCLVTDASRAMGMPPGRYRFGSATSGSWFESDGEVGRANGSLASSVVGMTHMVQQMQRLTSATLSDTIRMASLTPAERAGIADDVGSLAVGKRADVLVLSKRLALKKVVINGHPWQKPRKSSGRMGRPGGNVGRDGTDSLGTF